MIVVGFVLVALVGGWLLRRRARKDTLAGLNVERPTFQVEPPNRRHTMWKDGLL